MGDIATFWDPANIRGDWALSSKSPFYTAIATDPDVVDIFTEAGVELDIEGLQQKAADLIGGHDLETAVLISLFTDRTAEASDPIPDGTTDPRGWWGDEGEAYPIGSRIWTLDKRKATRATLNAAHDMIVEALKWLIDDGVAAAIAVLTEWTRPGFLGALITITQPTGPARAFAYSWVWSAL